MGERAVMPTSIAAPGRRAYRPSSLTVGDVYRALWRHRVLMVVVTAAVVAATGYLVSRQPKMYEASALVRVQQEIQNPAEAFGALETGQRLAQTYARITTTANIAHRIAKALGGAVPEHEIDGHLSASPVQNLDLLTISAANRSPEVARDVANAAPGALQAFIQQTGTLRDHVITVQPASVPTSPSSPRLKLDLVIALLLALLFNGALALALDVVRDRAEGADEIAAVAGTPVIGTVPALDLVRRREVQMLLARIDRRQVVDPALAHAGADGGPRA
jgi:capsular polysaccharide biosynthesis protein